MTTHHSSRHAGFSGGSRGWICFASLGLFAALMVGCGGGGGGSNSTPPPPPQTWTVFVYGHGDHNLSNSLLADMIEMCNAPLGSHMNVVVYADWRAGATAAATLSTTITSGAPFPSGVEWYKITGGSAFPTQLSVEPEKDLDQPTVLRAAVAKAFTDYPAQHRAMVMWDHGGAWKLGFGGDWQNGTSDPDSTGILASTTAQAIFDGLTDAGVTQKLEFVAFDTCLMMGAEEAEEFKGLAQTYLACAEIDFGNGWDYTATLGYISSHSTSSAQTIAAAEVSQWNAHHTGANSAGVAEDRTRSHAAIDLTKWTTFRNSYVVLWNSMSASSTLNWVEVARAGYRATPGYWNPIEEGSDQPILRDAGQFLGKLSLITSDATVRANAIAAKAAYDAVFIGTTMGTMRSSNSQTGMHTEHALAVDYKGSGAARLTSYKTTNWSVTSGSGNLLQTIVNQSDSVGPLPTTVVTPGTSSVGIQFDVSDTDVEEAQIFLFSDVGGGNLLTFGEIGQGQIDSSSIYNYSWNRSSVTLGNGSVASYGYVSRWVTSGSNSIYGIPGILSDGVNTVDATILFSETDTVSNLVVITDSDGRSIVDTLRAGYSFTPALLTYSSSSDTWSFTPQTTLVVPGSGMLNIQTYTVPAGNYLIGTSATDVWGNFDVQVDAIVLPAPG